MLIMLRQKKFRMLNIKIIWQQKRVKIIFTKIRIWTFKALNVKLQLIKFNNYVDQILPNFDHLPPQGDNRKHFTRYLPFVHVTKHRHSTDQLKSEP